MIKTSDRKLREKFAAQSTSDCNSYFDSKAEAINGFDDVLQSNGLMLSFRQWVNYTGDEGRAIVDIVDNVTEVVQGCCVLSWYLMPSGRWEVLGYIA